MSSAVTAYIALGSNLGDRAKHIETAIAALNHTRRIEVRAVSKLHETSPVGPVQQATFLNAAAALSTTLTARELLEKCLAIETAQGRKRESNQRWGPRTLDIDLLLFGDYIVDEPGLQIPHPHMIERAFVLAPLAEIAPDARHPRTGLTVRELLSRLNQRPASEYNRTPACSP